MNSYLLFKSLHLISVISWMAGLLYLPRIFVYHSENLKNFDMSSIFKTMERKLYYYIMMPAMFLSWFFGLILVSIIGFENLSLGWLKLKLIFVILLTIYHFYLGKILNDFKLDLNKNSSDIGFIVLISASNQIKKFDEILDKTFFIAKTL